MRKLLLTICVFFGLCLAMDAQQMEGQKEMEEMTLSEVSSLYQIQPRKWKSVHDPSVVWDAATQTFYIYGSHYYGVNEIGSESSLTIDKADLIAGEPYDLVLYLTDSNDTYSAFVQIIKE